MAALACDDKALVERLTKQFEQVQSGRISLLGFGALNLGDPPDWHREACSGVVVTRRHWSRIPYLKTSHVGDHKVLWEPNRHQYLLGPALLSALGSESGEVELVQRHLEAWLDDNPTSMGVNWCSSLEVAYRAITWCWLLALIPEARWNPALRGRIACALEDHGRHIERYLSIYFSPNTHLTGEALGLLYVGHVVSDSPFAKRWCDLGADILESWLPRQVYEDGVYFEQSTQYQRYTAEIYLHYLRIAESNGRIPSRSVRSSISRQFDVLRAIADGRGTMPLVGDDDGGSLLPIDLNPPDDLRGLLLAGAAALDRRELALPDTSQLAMSYLLCGISATRRACRATDEPRLVGSRYLALGGMAVIRDGYQRDDAVAVLDAGAHGGRSCAHAHADALACVLALGDQPLLIDRGTLTYMGPERNDYRSTASHNTMEFDGETAVVPLGPFQWGPRPPRSKATLRTCSPFTIFRGDAWGHAGTAAPSHHCRVVVHAVSGAWVVFDKGRRSRTSRATVRWQLAPGLELCSSGDAIDVTGSDGKAIAKLSIPVSHRVKITTREVSLRYGQKSDAALLEVEADDELRVVSMILPAHSSPSNISTIRTAKGTEQPSICTTWHDSDGYHQLMTPEKSGAVMDLSGWTADADLIWLLQPDCRYRESPQQDMLVAIGVRQLTPPGAAPLVAPDGGPMDGLDLVLRKEFGIWRSISLLNLNQDEE